MSSAASKVTAITPTTNPLSFVLFGATGRTGIPFMRQALTRGHRVTAFTRSANKIPAEFVGNANLTTVELELDQSDKIAKAIAKAKPDVIYTMLASDPSPHTAISTGVRAAHNALRSIREASTKSGDAAVALSNPTPFVVIAAWSIGPTRPLIHRWYERAFLSIAANTFYAPVMKDFELMAAELESPTIDGIIQPILLMPPVLTNGVRTDTYEFGDALTEMKEKMHVFDRISRESMANLALLLGEKAIAGEAISKYIALRQP